MDEEDDGPPMLVAADGQPVEDISNAQPTDEKLPRVPITIITGMGHAILLGHLNLFRLT